MSDKFRISRLQEMDSQTGATLENGCRFIECLKAGELGELDATYITVPPKKSTQAHSHRYSRCFIFVVDGSAIAHLDGAKRRIAINDFLLIQPGVIHSIEALEEGATLFSMHSPPLASEEDVDLEFRKIPRAS